MHWRRKWHLLQWKLYWKVNSTRAEPFSVLVTVVSSEFLPFSTLGNIKMKECVAAPIWHFISAASFERPGKRALKQFSKAGV